MKVMPIRYCADIAASTRFYEALGLAIDSASRTGFWVEMPAAAGMLALHAAGDTEGGATDDCDRPGSCELSFESGESLETVATRLKSAGFAPEAIVDESFGRSLRVRDPDGVLVQVNEHDRGLYT